MENQRTVLKSSDLLAPEGGVQDMLELIKKSLPIENKTPNVPVQISVNCISAAALRKAIGDMRASAQNVAIIDCRSAEDRTDVGDVPYAIKGSFPANMTNTDKGEPTLIKLYNSNATRHLFGPSPPSVVIFYCTYGLVRSPQMCLRYLNWWSINSKHLRTGSRAPQAVFLKGGIKEFTQHLSKDELRNYCVSFF